MISQSENRRNWLYKFKSPQTFLLKNKTSPDYFKEEKPTLPRWHTQNMDMENSAMEIQAALADYRISVEKATASNPMPD